MISLNVLLSNIGSSSLSTSFISFNICVQAQRGPPNGASGGKGGNIVLQCKVSWEHDIM